MVIRSEWQHLPEIVAQDIDVLRWLSRSISADEEQALKAALEVLRTANIDCEFAPRALRFILTIQDEKELERWTSSPRQEAAQELLRLGREYKVDLSR